MRRLHQRRDNSVSITGTVDERYNRPLTTTSLQPRRIASFDPLVLGTIDNILPVFDLLFRPRGAHQPVQKIDFTRRSDVASWICLARSSGLNRTPNASARLTAGLMVDGLAVANRDQLINLLVASWLERKLRVWATSRCAPLFVGADQWRIMSVAQVVRLRNCRFHRRRRCTSTRDGANATSL